MPIHGLAPSSTPLKPAHFDIEKAIRSNILALQPYRNLREDNVSGIFFDSNENPLGHSISPSLDLSATLQLDLHRYPSLSNVELKHRIADMRGVPGPDHVFLGAGSIDIIDLLMRVCVAPEREKVLITPPTYTIFPVYANINDVGIVEVPLELSGDHGEGGDKGRFSLKVDEVKKAIDADPSIKLIFICSPGNPTGTLVSLSAIRSLLDYDKYKGIVAVDEAYIDFARPHGSAVSLIKDYANLVVIQTLSKGFGLASLRLGLAIAQPPLIQILTNTKGPYSIPGPSGVLASRALEPSSLDAMHSKLQTLIASRASLKAALATLAPLGVGPTVGSDDANFLMFPILEKGKADGKPDNERAHNVFKSLSDEKGIVVRFTGNELGCAACLRISIGSEEENKTLIDGLKAVLEQI